MSVARELPADLRARLGSARQVEVLAETEEQYRHAVYATTTLLLAAVAAGWRLVELAGPLGISASTASKRTNDARRAGRLHPSGLIVEPPLPVRSPLAEFAAPAEARDWLTRAEAARYLELAPRTVHGLYMDGLLPNTRTVGRKWRAYLRADLDRVRRGPRRGAGLDRKALLTVVEESGSGR